MKSRVGKAWGRGNVKLYEKKGGEKERKGVIDD